MSNAGNKDRIVKKELNFPNVENESHESRKVEGKITGAVLVPKSENEHRYRVQMDGEVFDTGEDKTELIERLRLKGLEPGDYAFC